MAPRIFVENDLTTMIVLEDVDLMLDTGPAHNVVMSIKIGLLAGINGVDLGELNDNGPYRAPRSAKIAHESAVYLQQCFGLDDPQRLCPLA